MEFTKSRKIVSKLNTLMDSFESIGEELSEIEVSLLSKYTDDLKQSFVDMCHSPNLPTENLVKEKLTTSDEDEVSYQTPISEQTIANDSHKSQTTAEPIEEVNSDVVNSESNVKSGTPPLDVKEEGSTTTKDENQNYSWKQDKSITIEETFESDNGDSMSSEDDDMDFGDLFNTIEVKELSDRLKNSSIKDLNKSISINERILLKNELFNGDQSIMSETISHLNELENFDQAAEYLKKGVAREFNWVDTNKMKKAIVFLQTVQRLYK